MADDQEVFTSPSDFVRDVTRDALRHFSSIAIDSRGPTMSISITFRWTGERPDSGDWDLFTGWFKSITWSGRDAEITVSAHGVDAAREREALKTVHNAIKRGGTDRFDQRRAFLIGVQLATVGVFIAALLALTFLASSFSNMVWDLLRNLPALTLGLLSVAVALGVTVGRWAYPSLEVAERGETRLWRLARWIGGIAVTIAVAVVIKTVTSE